MNQNNLISKNLAEDFSNAIAGLTSIQAITNGLVTQPELSLSELPNFPSYQKETRKLAHKYLSQAPEVMAELSVFISAYSNEFQALEKHLSELANQSETNADNSSNDSLRQGFQVLGKTINLDHTKRIRLLSNMTNLEKEVELSLANYQKVFQKAEKELGPKKINSIKTQATAVFQKIQADNETIAKGATEDIVPILKSVAAVIMTSEDEGAAEETAEVVVTSISQINEATKKQKEAMDDVQIQIQRYKELMSSLKAAELTFGIVCSIAAQLKLFADELAKLNHHIQVYNKCWENLKTGLSDLQEELSQGTITSLPKQIVEAQTFWVNMKKEANKLGNIGLIKFEINKE